MMNYHRPDDVSGDLKQKLMEALKETVKPTRPARSGAPTEKEASQGSSVVNGESAGEKNPNLDHLFGVDAPAAAPPEDEQEPLEIEIKPNDNLLEDGKSVYGLLVEEDEEDAQGPLPEELEAASRRLHEQMKTLSMQESSEKSDFNDTLSLGTPPVEQTPMSARREPPRTTSADLRPQERQRPVDRESITSMQNTVVSGGTMADLSGYKDLSKAPLSFGTDAEEAPSRGPIPERPPVREEGGFDMPPIAAAQSLQEVDTEFSGNVKTLIRLVNELPEGVTKQTGAQIIRLTMEAMGISMEDVLTEAQSAQSEMLDAVRANIKKIEEYKTVIRKLETDIKYYQGKANELSEIIDLFILSNTSGNKMPSPDDLHE